MGTNLRRKHERPRRESDADDRSRLLQAAEVGRLPEEIAKNRNRDIP